jgi:hypothetical protein
MRKVAAIVTLAMTFGSVIWALAADISALKQFKANNETQFDQITHDIREIRRNQTQMMRLLIKRND